jgi:hypothetical protein
MATGDRIKDAAVRDVAAGRPLPQPAPCPSTGTADAARHGASRHERLTPSLRQPRHR